MTRFAPLYPISHPWQERCSGLLRKQLVQNCGRLFLGVPVIGHEVRSSRSISATTGRWSDASMTSAVPTTHDRTNRSLGSA